MRVYKYQLPEKEYFNIAMPLGARILHVDLQDDAPMIWAEIDERAPEAARYFRITGTGWKLDESYPHYIGTWQKGPFVWHLYGMEKP